MRTTDHFTNEHVREADVKGVFGLARDDPLPSMRGTLLPTGSTYSFKNVFLTGITILIFQCFHLLARVTDRVKDL